MTRDEAIKIMSQIWGGSPQHGLGNSYVDAFVALGILKLDEPKSAWDKFEDAARSEQGWASSAANGGILSDVRYILSRAGLKIVEK